MAPKGTTLPSKAQPGGRAFVINGPTYSDGDVSQMCTRDNATLTHPNSDAYQAYLQKIATKWIDEEAGGAEAGKIYSLPGLPAGYTLWERPRPSNPKHTDRWLFGHRSAKQFDSPNRFYPHWKYLLNYDSGQACKCDLCAGESIKHRPGRSQTSSTPATTKPRGRPPLQRPLQSGPVDEEGTPDVHRSLFTLLKNEGRINRRIEERASLDWRAEKPLVDAFATTIAKQPSFLPRHGEIVLYLRPLPSHLVLRQDPTSHQFRIFNLTSETYATHSPQWLAGIVTQVPSSTPTIASLNLSSASSTPYPPNGNGPRLNTTGYRISPVPSPSSSQKNLSKQHTYTSLSLIRPFSLRTHLLRGIDPSNYHPSITNALTLSATVCLIDKNTFSGKWPDAEIHSRGVFAGWESYWIGDTVVLLPNSPETEAAAEIMVIIDIVTTFHILHSLAGSQDVTGSTCKTITIELHGNVYTRNRARSSSSHLPVSPAAAHTGPMLGYGEWFHLDQPRDIFAAPFPRILSRLYEKEAVQTWLPSLRQPTRSHSTTTTTTTTTTGSHLLDQGRKATLEARAHAAVADERIKDADAGGGAHKHWLWADHRAEALDLREVAGLEVGRYDSERRPEVWRSVLRVLDGQAEKVAGRASTSTEDTSVAGNSSVGEKKKKSRSSEAVTEGPGEEGTGIDEGDGKKKRMKRVRVEVPVPLIQLD